jgi:hypothetical protein
MGSYHTDVLGFGRFMFSSSFFRVGMGDDLVTSSWPPSRNPRGPVETVREFSVGKTMTTAILKEQAVEIVPADR